MNSTKNIIPLDSTIKELQSVGWIVRCTYFRYSENYPFSLKPVYDMQHEKEEPKLQNSRLVKSRRTFREQPQANGGAVMIELLEPGKYEAEPFAAAISACSRKDAFVKKIGRQLALTRCIEKANQKLSDTNSPIA
jgi:hypothetical protein